MTKCVHVDMVALQVAKEASRQGLSPLKVKKIYVLVAIMVSGVDVEGGGGYYFIRVCSCAG